MTCEQSRGGATISADAVALGNRFIYRSCTQSLFLVCSMPDANQPKRIRDPVHGLIVFTIGSLDQLAWALLNTPEMQRLRRVKQLGMSEFVFPGATHSRFAHSVASGLLRIEDHLN